MAIPVYEPAHQHFTQSEREQIEDHMNLHNIWNHPDFINSVSRIVALNAPPNIPWMYKVAEIEMPQNLRMICEKYTNEWHGMEL